MSAVLWGCGVVCCAAQHTAFATLTLPCTRLVAHQSTGQLQPNTLMNSLTLGGLAEHQGMPQGITDSTYWGPSYMLGHTLSLYIPHLL